MNKGGIGVGSASIILVFAVLCLAVFSLISFVVASNDRALVESEAQLVVGFFEADALAENIVADLLESESIPSSLHGVEIHTEFDFFTGGEVAVFSSPINDYLAILVRLAIHYDSYEILSWRMYDTSEWEYDAGLNVWLGPPGLYLDDYMDFGYGTPWLD